jgi:adenosine deaminase
LSQLPKGPRERDSTMANIVNLLASRGKYSDDIERFIQDMPKVELHVHLDGSFAQEILYRHLQKKNSYNCFPSNSILPWDQSLWPVRQLVEECRNFNQFHALCTCRGKRSLTEMIKCFEIFNPLVQGNLELIEELSYDFCRRQAEQRVIYTECRYSPHLLAKGASLTGTDSVDPLPVFEAVTRGLRRGSSDFGIVVNQILCCITWRPDWADDVVHLASERKEDYPCGVVAVDIAAGEEHFDNANFPHLHEPHLRAMKKAQRLNINITMHAGEVGSGENVKLAIRKYGATRIGHGYRIVDDAALMEELKEKGIHLETCPTSSRETGGWETLKEKDWTKHPCVTMMENNLAVSFNSDDPAVFNTSLSWQYRTVVAKMKLEKDVLLASIKAGIDAAFCSDAQKQSLHRTIDAFETGQLPNFGKIVFRDRVIENNLVPAESM